MNAAEMLLPGPGRQRRLRRGTTENDRQFTGQAIRSNEFTGQAIRSKEFTGQTIRPRDGAGYSLAQGLLKRPWSRLRLHFLHLRRYFSLVDLPGLKHNEHQPTEQNLHRLAGRL